MILTHPPQVDTLISTPALTYSSNFDQTFINFLSQAILKQTSAFGPYDIPTIVAKLHHYQLSIGVKKLLDLLDMVKQMGEQNRMIKFLSKLEEENYAVPIAH